jgi:hypothetical protein
MSLATVGTWAMLEMRWLAANPKLLNEVHAFRQMKKQLKHIGMALPHLRS